MEHGLPVQATGRRPLMGDSKLTGTVQHGRAPLLVVHRLA
jgi:hypothetical protein